jgi:hypothetical protein
MQPKKYNLEINPYCEFCRKNCSFSLITKENAKDILLNGVNKPYGCNTVNLALWRHEMAEQRKEEKRKQNAGKI